MSIDLALESVKRLLYLRYKKWSQRKYTYLH